MQIITKFFITILVISSIFTITLTTRYYFGRHNVNQINAHLQKATIVIPPVDSAEILPIVEYRTARPDLRIEDGISYLIQSDDQSILLDVGYNRKAETSSPLLHNLQQLGINPDTIGAFMISHCHPDHVGGMEFRQKKINLSTEPVELHGKKIYTPIPMSCASGNVVPIDRASLITPTIASTGPLAAQIFVPGQLREQALLIHLRNKGLILVSGCGHPGIIQMVNSAQKMTGLPVYAVVGGFHMYYTKVDSLFWRNLFGSSRLFARSMTKQEVEHTIRQLKTMGIQKVFISPHDADQATLDLFAETFGTDYEPVMAGKPITLGGR